MSDNHGFTTPGQAFVWAIDEHLNKPHNKPHPRENTHRRLCECLFDRANKMLEASQQPLIATEKELLTAREAEDSVSERVMSACLTLDKSDPMLPMGEAFIGWLIAKIDDALGDVVRVVSERRSSCARVVMDCPAIYLYQEDSQVTYFVHVTIIKFAIGKVT